MVVSQAVQLQGNLLPEIPFSLHDCLFGVRMQYKYDSPYMTVERHHSRRREVETRNLNPLDARYPSILSFYSVEQLLQSYYNKGRMFATSSRTISSHSQFCSSTPCPLYMCFNLSPVLLHLDVKAVSLVLSNTSMTANGSHCCSDVVSLCLLTVTRPQERVSLLSLVFERVMKTSSVIKEHLCHQQLCFIHYSAQVSQ